MKISDIVSQNTIITSLKATNKREVLEEMSAKLARHENIDVHLVEDAMLERENLGSTAYGGGVAFPHARIDGAKRVKAYFTKLAQPVDFDAIDSQPVDLIFMLVSPENSGADHLEALAVLSKTLRNKTICSKLRKAASKDEIYKILTR
ncbi:MAG: PTS sugar transporter subunit IIA [Alphaproteobacteria bacterium]|nr:PTS sugar transporter subunit IIA [Alphaproteobacteria bacterium]MBQ7659129.1 PTS sugar transporter subunit IIA [Alphaproteobacteria bacterium]